MEKATQFLRDKGLNHSFKLDGGNFKGNLLELLREYEKELSKLPQPIVGGSVCPHKRIKYSYRTGGSECLDCGAL